MNCKSVSVPINDSSDEEEFNKIRKVRIKILLCIFALIISGIFMYFMTIL